MKFRKFDIYSALVGFGVIAGGLLFPDLNFWVVPIVGAVALVIGGLVAGIIPWQYKDEQVPREYSCPVCRVRMIAIRLSPLEFAPHQHRERRFACCGAPVTTASGMDAAWHDCEVASA